MALLDNEVNAAIYSQTVLEYVFRFDVESVFWNSTLTSDGTFGQWSECSHLLPDCTRRCRLVWCVVSILELVFSIRWYFWTMERTQPFTPRQYSKMYFGSMSSLLLWNLSLASDGTFGQWSECSHLLPDCSRRCGSVRCRVSKLGTRL